MSRRAAAAVAAAALSLAGAAATSTAGADSFTPIRMTVAIAPIARARVPLHTTVSVSADAGVLDLAQGPMRVGVKLAVECGGTFETTPGVTLVDHALTPQPTRGKAYTATARGSGRPVFFGAQTLCVFLEDSTVGRVFANDESGSVTVSKPCTNTALRYDRATKTLKAAQRALRRTSRHRTARRRQLQRRIARDRRTATRDRRGARAACGGGVPL